MNSRMQMPGGSTNWRFGTFFGNTIYVQPLFLILIAILSLSGIQSYSQLAPSLLLIPALFFSVLFHELGHAVATKYFGYGNSTIILHGFGGVTINDSNAYRTPLKSAAIDAVGPLSSGLLAAVGYLLLRSNVLFLLPNFAAITVATMLQSFVMLNLIFAIFNALPILPMDGGDFVLHILQHFIKDGRKAAKIAVIISMSTLVLSAIPLLYFFNAGLFTILILGMLLYQNVTLLRSL